MKGTSALAFLAAFVMTLLLTPLAWNAQAQQATGKSADGKQAETTKAEEQQGQEGQLNVEERVRKSTEVLQEIMKIPEESIPPALLRQAEAIAILPSVYKVGFVVGGRYGKGVLAIRDEKGNWDNPFFITLAGGSVGYQIGAQATDLILVFKDRGKAEEIRKGKFTLGANAAVAAGPVGRKAEAATDVKLESEIYSYSRSRGLFAGVSLEGAVLEPDDQATQEYYGQPAGELKKVKKVPEAVKQFKQALKQHASQ